MAEMQAQFMQRQMTQQVVVTKAPADPNTTLFKRFNEMDPPTFTGTKGEVDAENWIKRIEQIFRIMGATDEEKLNLATFMLTEEAYHWWEAMERTLTASTAAGASTAAIQVTWAQFLDAFDEKYFSAYYQSERRREFMTLQQGSMSMDEYVGKFTALSRFAPSMVASERDQCEKFKMGLNSRILPRVSVHQTRNFAKLVEQAKIAERDVNSTDTRREQSKKARFDAQSQQRGGRSVGGSSGSSAPASQSRFSFGRGRGSAMPRQSY